MKTLQTFVATRASRHNPVIQQRHIVIRGRELAERLMPGSQRCCQANGNSSPVWRNFPNPGLALAHDRAPLGQSG